MFLHASAIGFDVLSQGHSPTTLFPFHMPNMRLVLHTSEDRLGLHNPLLQFSNFLEWLTELKRPMTTIIGLLQREQLRKGQVEDMTGCWEGALCPPYRVTAQKLPPGILTEVGLGASSHLL